MHLPLYAKASTFNVPSLADWFLNIYIYFCKNLSKIPPECQMDPDQAQHFVRPDLSTKYLQRFSVDNTRRQRVKNEYDQKISHTTDQPSAPWERLK